MTRPPSLAGDGQLEGLIISADVVLALTETELREGVRRHRRGGIHVVY